MPQGMPSQKDTVPPSSAKRVEGLDLARYLAFIGMVIVNFKVVMGVEPGGSVLNIMTGALEGRAAATFVVLAGIGLGLSQKSSSIQTILTTIKRALFLLVIGLLNMLVFDADIIHYYAFFFLFGMFFLPASTRFLIASIVALNVLFVVLVCTLNYDQGWNWHDYSYDDFWTPNGFIRNLFFNGWHPVIPWLGFFLFGIVLSRIELSKRSVQLFLATGGGVLMLFSEGVSAFLQPVFLAIDPEAVFLISTDPVPPTPFYSLVGMGAASMMIGLCALSSDWLKSVGIMKLIAPAGRQTLTLYIAHILIGMGVLEAFGMLENQTIGAAFISALIFSLLATIYAFVWMRFFKQGPIEILMRFLTK
tara:strand:+ start:92 stop:1174 length:1083 start_codon:yes stop_codon:yes gene_type:complete